MQNFMEIGLVVFAGEYLGIKIGCSSYNTSKPVEGERRFFEPRNGPEQMGNARNLIFCRECRMGILFGPIEAIF